MTATIRYPAAAIACLLSAWQASSASAQEAERQDDTQLWLIAVASGEIGPRIELTVDGTVRFREQVRGRDQQTLRATVLREVREDLAVGGGIGVFEAGGRTEIRPFQQLSASLGRVSARTRLEQRFFDGADRMELRFRQRVGYSQPLAERWSGSAEGEWLYLLQRRNADGENERTQWRGRVMVSHETGPRLSISAAYLAIYDPRGIATDRLAHIPQVILNVRF